MKPICGITFVQSVDLSVIVTLLESFLGEVEDRTSPFAFSFTSYYQKEMGPLLDKCFVSFVELIQPARLPKIKQKTNEIEKEWSVEGKRKINLDPGYITGAKVVLASTKDYAHRIYLADGIYGDVQLQFREHRFWPLQWTYPDYQTDLAVTFFQRVREKYIKQENKGGKSNTL